jgi:hypothetical protein
MANSPKEPFCQIRMLNIGIGRMSHASNAKVTTAILAELISLVKLSMKFGLD